YEAAKDRLERKYGGRRRQIAVYLEEIEHFKQVHSGNAKDLEQFADLLDIALRRLQEAGQFQELGDGSLYHKLQRKLPEAMLAQYNRWIFENSKPESVYTLRAWVIQESEFQTIASETVYGLAGKVTKELSNAPTMKFRNQRTFFGEAKDSRELQKFPCKVCGQKHGIWSCPDFKQKSVSDRWDTSKQSQLCFRCLGDGHNGKSCPRSRQCGINGCKQLHHRLLHRSESTRPMSTLSDKSKQSDAGISGDDNLAQETVATRIPPITEGKTQTQPMTMMTQDYVETAFIGLRTVPVILKNGDRSVKVNALLDDASTKTYVNADVAAEIGLKGKTEKVTVNVLNGLIDTFETQPINVRLQSINGNVSIDVTAYTANRVTGSMPVVDWNSYKRKWPHLRNIEFPRSTSRPIADVLIGLDCADLHYAHEEIRGRPGEPVARLTPLGWTCIGSPGLYKNCILQTNFSCTYFARETSEIERLNLNHKKFWEIESAPSSHTARIVRIEEQLALKKKPRSKKRSNSEKRSKSKTLQV
ncbi:MAG: DUF1759 domain-containing protein, partial [Candidatus Thiodiazotropha taylori]|nr:DUF1759 domain-containing protein [Candidatus Thiodiazotropha taylori]MCW4309503.1 DUF1759 domain-containing protein [Candidatus Thiodiazotropha endolucinida]